ncbi:carbon-nitrogen hydrolase family protein [Leucobacter celer]|uniref:carbon-nitrogen hydrolase family protein n=1 Tax=Leucobacter celer TaxID=668625 RepID=UPI0006A75D88|nr:carbon-nitrogen hydrolase family protein [Leucobacter celer]
MRIALCQFTAGTDKAANLRGILDRVDEAASQQVDLLIFPEYVMYMSDESSAAIRDQAESLDGPFVTALRNAAQRHAMHLICNVFESSHESRPFNTSVVIDDSGELIGSYRKAHLYDAFAYRESANVRAASHPEPLVLAIHGFKVGVMICYDLRFPEWARANVDRGADLLVYSAGWPPGPRKEDHWTTMLRSRAIENTSYVAGVVQGPPLAIGTTLLVDPLGGIEGELTNEDGLLIRDISPERVRRVRELNPSLQNRLPEGALSTPD